MKTTKKHENDKFLVITLKHVSGLKVDVNRPETIKLWAMAHENDHKMRKLRVLGRIYPTSMESYGRCKSAWNPKIVGKTTIKRENDEFLFRSLKHVTCLLGHANPLGIQKQWEITDEN